MHFFRNAFLTETAYPTDTIGHLCVISIFYALQYAFYNTLSDFIGPSGPPPVWISIFLSSYIISSLVTDFFSHSVNRFFKYLTMGMLDPLLTKPIGLASLIFFKWCKPMYLTLTLIPVSYIAYELHSSSLHLLSLNWTQWALTLTIGIISSLAFIVTLNSLSFISQRELPVDFIHSELNAFGIIPISFYPLNLSYALTTILPMLVVASISTDSLINGMSSLWFTFIVLAIIHTTLSLIIFLQLSKKFDSIGG